MSLDPIHIAIDSVPRTSQSPLYISLGSLLISFASAFITYFLNIRGRRSGWFHKVAVDPMLVEIFSFFDSEQTKLADAAAANQNARGGKKLPSRNASLVLTDFQQGQAALYDQIKGRIEIFNSKAAEGISDLLEAHQDTISGALFRGRDDVIDALLATKKELMSAIRAADR